MDRWVRMMFAETVCLGNPLPGVREEHPHYRLHTGRFLKAHSAGLYPPKTRTPAAEAERLLPRMRSPGAL
jgi:hypothetical protein